MASSPRMRGSASTSSRQQADAFLHTAQHPTLGRGYVNCAYAPMVELLRYLEANGFSNYIASGGGRDFMRPISEEMYGIPRDRVIGSSTALDYRDGDDHAQAGGRRSGRRPGEAGPDLEPHRPTAAPCRRQLERRRPDARFRPARGRPTLRLLVLHDDAEREFDYTAGAEASLDARRRRAGRWSASRTIGRPCSARGSNQVLVDMTKTRCYGKSHADQNIVRPFAVPSLRGHGRRRHPDHVRRQAARPARPPRRGAVRGHVGDPRRVQAARPRRSTRPRRASSSRRPASTPRAC